MCIRDRYLPTPSTDESFTNVMFASNDTPEYAVHFEFTEDTYARAIHMYANIIIIGA